MAAAFRAFQAGVAEDRGREVGQRGADGSLPFFACKAMGDVMLAAARSCPKCQILVLCGRTHGGGEIQVAENLRVVTRAAEYGKPEVQRVIEVG
jgi:enoyl-CoA hydratase/carnithine racemase